MSQGEGDERHARASGRMHSTELAVIRQETKARAKKPKPRLSPEGQIEGLLARPLPKIYLDSEDLNPDWKRLAAERMRWIEILLSDLPPLLEALVKERDARAKPKPPVPSFDHQIRPKGEGA